jgi:hypothetical protein
MREDSMAGNEPTYFDLKTVSLMREALDDAWACLRVDQKAATSRTILAEAILKLAAQGERDHERLLDGALNAVIRALKTNAA